MSTFRDLIRDFLSPDGAEVSLGFLKAKYSDASRPAIVKVLATLRGTHTFFTHSKTYSLIFGKKCGG